MERLFARLAALLLAGSAAAVPAPEHRDRFEPVEKITYKWVEQEHWFVDPITGVLYCGKDWVRLPDFREYRPMMPKGIELPK